MYLYRKPQNTRIRFRIRQDTLRYSIFARYGHGLLSGRGCLREMMTAQDVVAVCLLCRLVSEEPRLAPLLSPPRQHRMAAQVSEEHSTLETLLPRVCCPRVRSDPTASLHGLRVLLAAPSSPCFPRCSNPFRRNRTCSKIQKFQTGLHYF